MKRRLLASPILLLQVFLFLLAFGQTPTPRETKSIGQMMDEALQSMDKDHARGSKQSSDTGATNSPAPSPARTGAAPAGGNHDLCDMLLEAPFGKYLPRGYSSPKASLTQMTAAERAAGVVCKISVMLQGSDRFNAIRYRIYDSEAAAERGFKSLAKGLPSDITLIADNLKWQSERGGRVPCMVFTAGDRSLSFVTCADQSGPIVVSGVSSQPNHGNSYSTDTVTKAGQLLVAGIDSYEAEEAQEFDKGWKQIFGRDEKKQ